MIELRMARLAPIQPDRAAVIPRDRETALAFSYLTTFRRIVVGLAVIGTLIALANGWNGPAAALATIGIGELIESSYYLTVLRWRQDSVRGSKPATDRHAQLP